MIPLFLEFNQYPQNYMEYQHQVLVLLMLSLLLLITFSIINRFSYFIQSHWDLSCFSSVYIWNYCRLLDWLCRFLYNLFLKKRSTKTRYKHSHCEGSKYFHHSIYNHKYYLIRFYTCSLNSFKFTSSYYGIPIAVLPSIKTF